MTAEAHQDDARRSVGRYEWEGILRRATLSKDVKYIGFLLATFADPDGTRIRPGEEELAAAAGQGKSTVRRRVAELRSRGLLAQVSRGGGRGGYAKAAEYRLTLPLDLLEQIELRPPGGAARQRRMTVVTALTQASAVDEETPLAQESAQSEPSPVDNSETALALVSGESESDESNERSNDSVTKLMSAQKSVNCAHAERATTGHLTNHHDRPSAPDPTQLPTARAPTEPPPDLRPARCPHGLPNHTRNGQPTCPLCRRHPKEES